MFCRRSGLLLRPASRAVQVSAVRTCSTPLPNRAAQLPGDTVRRAVREGQQCSLDAMAAAGFDIGKPATQGDNLMLRDFRAALAALPGEQRATVLLIGLEGLKY